MPSIASSWTVAVAIESVWKAVSELDQASELAGGPARVYLASLLSLAALEIEASKKAGVENGEGKWKAGWRSGVIDSVLRKVWCGLLRSWC